MAVFTPDYQHRSWFELLLEEQHEGHNVPDDGFSSSHPRQGRQRKHCGLRALASRFHVLSFLARTRKLKSPQATQVLVAAASALEVAGLLRRPWAQPCLQHEGLRPRSLQGLLLGGTSPEPLVAVALDGCSAERGVFVNGGNTCYLNSFLQAMFHDDGVVAARRRRPHLCSPGRLV